MVSHGTFADTITFVVSVAGSMVVAVVNTAGFVAFLSNKSFIAHTLALHAFSVDTSFACFRHAIGTGPSFAANTFRDFFTFLRLRKLATSVRRVALVEAFLPAAVFTGETICAFTFVVLFIHAFSMTRACIWALPY